MTFPHIDPVIFSFGPLAVRWYGMMYLFGFIGGYFMMCHIAKLREMPIKNEMISDLLFYGVLGVVLGGRLGYTLFYNTQYYLNHPLKIFYVWEGGMSFHGGLIGVLIVLVLFCQIRKLNIFMVADLVVSAVPIGLGFGRIGNFINSELWGRVTDSPWGIVFPNGGPLPRHPSQLYEAGLEGIVLFILIYLLHRSGAARGIPAFTFLLGYGVFRFLIEFVRQPDEQLGFLWGGATMGQLLSLPMILFGISGLFYLLRRVKS
ncbi:MAG: prolipoprotein diacylglyceryl transferase [Desulfuromusa sp.]|jgi:phosphatidylglycerol:prolipoprotein diacylglycerol transferase|nr:prolipoprotein diacylglyceryl transferase [Desulfuromusa sp.]